MHALLRCDDVKSHLGSLRVLKLSAGSLVFLLGFVTLCCGQSAVNTSDSVTNTPAEIFSLAAKQSDIRAAGAPPFRLKATFTATDEKGQVSTGEYSEVWIAKDRWRRDLTEGSRTEASARILDDCYSATSNFDTDDIVEALTPFVPPANDADEVNRTWRMGQQDISGVQLLRVAHMMRFTDKGELPETEYLFDPQKGYLLGVGSLSQLVTYSKLHLASGKVVPFAVMIKYPGRKQNLTVNVTSFEAAGNPPDDTFTMPGASRGKCVEGHQEVDPKALQKNVISKGIPEYPEGARSGRKEGDVVLHITISRNGEVKNIHLVSSPRADFAGSAIAAVQANKYRPFLWAGMPVEVDGTITIKYRTH